MKSDDLKERVGSLLWAIRAIRAIEIDPRARHEDLQTHIAEIHRLTNEALDVWQHGLTPSPDRPPGMAPNTAPNTPRQKSS